MIPYMIITVIKSSAPAGAELFLFSGIRPLFSGGIPYYPIFVFTLKLLHYMLGFFLLTMKRKIIILSY